MVAVGGVTRLTESGLSIVEWKPVSGSLPPLSEADWTREFEQYKVFKGSKSFQQNNFFFFLQQYPEYKKYVLGFT